jgi:hypothetical protein
MACTIRSTRARVLAVVCAGATLGIFLLVESASAQGRYGPLNGWAGFKSGSWIEERWRVVDLGGTHSYRCWSTRSDSESIGPTLIKTNNPDSLGSVEALDWPDPERESIVVGTVAYVVDGQTIPCDVVRTFQLPDFRGEGQPRIAAADSNFTWEWRSSDLTKFSGVMREVSQIDPGLSNHGRPLGDRDSMIWRVVHLHRAVRVGGQRLDCVVSETRGAGFWIGGTIYIGDVTEWTCAEVPGGVVRRREEAVDSKSGKRLVSDCKLVGFKVIR